MASDTLHVRLLRDQAKCRMVATVALYGGHAIVAGLVCSKARHARSLLGGGWLGVQAGHTFMPY